jgi:hypothetical protein
MEKQMAVQLMNVIQAGLHFIHSSASSLSPEQSLAAVSSRCMLLRLSLSIARKK